MAAVVVLVATACGASNDAVDSATTTVPPPPSTRAPGTTPPAISTLPLEITQTPITPPGGTPLGTLTGVDGRGNAVVPLPADVGGSAIVHAQYTGVSTFVVSAVDATGRDLTVLAQSVGSYDGTFPIGFVNQTASPATGIRVATTGPWHLDIGGAALAPPLAGRGVSGRGDAVLGYTGPQVSAHVVYPGTAHFAVSAFANGAVRILVSTTGPYDGRVQLPGGPAFISVTATGKWSMTLG